MSLEHHPKSQMAYTRALNHVPTTPPHKSIETHDFPIFLSPPSIIHNIPAPPTPPPPPVSLEPAPLRYPETLGNLIEIRESESKGLGVFAVRDMLPGTIILCEAPLITLIDTGTRADPLDIAVNSLPALQKESFFSLSHFSSNKNESVSRSIVYSNGYSINNDLATGVFETASRINHSCVPNCSYVWKDELGRMVFWNRFKLLEGEECTVDYGHKKKQLERIYGFVCRCGGCTDGESTSCESGEMGRVEGEQRRGIDAVVQESMDGKTS